MGTSDLAAVRAATMSDLVHKEALTEKHEIVEQLQAIKGEIGLIYLDWESTYTWLKDLHETHDLRLQPKRNPFIEHRAPLRR